IGASENDFIELCPVGFGIALHELANRNRGKIVRANGRQRASEASDWSANRVADEYRSCHSIPRSRRSLSVRDRSAVQQITQHTKFFFRRSRRLLYVRSKFDFPASRFCDLVARHVGMKLSHGEFFRVFVRFHDAQIGDNSDSAFSGKSEFLACIATIEIADGGKEVEFLHKGAGGLFENEDDFFRTPCDFGSAASAGKTCNSFLVAADDRSVDVRKFVDLRGAEKTDIYAAALQPVAKNLRSRNDGVGAFREIAVADGKRKNFRFCADGPGFIDENDIRRVSQPCKICGCGGQANSNKTDRAVFEQSRSRDGHHFGRAVVWGAQTSCSFALSLRTF